MEIIIQTTAEASTAIASRVITHLLREKPDSVLGLATGATPLKLYGELIRLHREEGLDFSRVTTFNLDEYVGLAPDHPGSYARYMNENLFDAININPQNAHIPNGVASDIPAHCQAYEKAIHEAGGIDLQVLGIGTDGHIGFNEPASSPVSRTRMTTLHDQTRKDNAEYFDSLGDVPTHAVTMGIGTILESRSCLLLAFGERKAPAVASAVEGPIVASIPASALQSHPDTRLLLDEDSASLLKRADHYRAAYEDKPEWQKR